MGDLGSVSGLGRSPGGGHGNPLQYSCLENPHGLLEAFDQVDVLNKAAQIYIAARGMGFEPDGMTDAQLWELSAAFGLPK